MTHIDLLIFYFPGSRGDFLAAVLTDQIRNHYRDYAISNLDIHYHKIHRLDLNVNPFDKSLNETSILKYRDQSIRIKLTHDDCTTVATRLEKIKNLPYIDSFQIMRSQAKMWEDEYRKLDIKFRYVVWFSDLFDIEFLKNFYHRFNGRPMPVDLIPMIEYNIALQSNICDPSRSVM